MEAIVSHYKVTPPRCPALEGVHRFNNFVKAVLIQTFLKPCGQVLDMPCGRGGDLKKYRENKAGFYVGIDVVQERVEEAKKRHRTTKCMFGALFEVADFAKPLDLECRYDLVSCQFALHYAWDTEARARQVLRNGAERLQGGGSFILTFPDWVAITDRLFAMAERPDEHNYMRQSWGVNLYRIGGARHFLEFTSPEPFDKFMQSLQTEPFGRSYVYHQEGAVEGLEEFLIEPRAFEDMCKEEGLSVVSNLNFIEFDTDAPLGSDVAPLRSRMCGAFPPDPESRLIIGLYRAVVLQPTRKRAKR